MMPWHRVRAAEACILDGPLSYWIRRLLARAK